MYEKMKKGLNVVFVLMFILGVGMCLISGFLTIDDNADYKRLQPELRTPELIDCVLGNSKTGMIYVCYTNGSAVNVYDETTGEFLWAVSTPYLRHSYFDLDTDRLYIYGAGEAYLYDSKTGAFLEKGESDAYSLSFDPQEDTSVQGEPVPGKVYYDRNEVYKINPDGSRKTIVAGEWWYLFFNVFMWWLVGFLGGLGKGALLLLDKIRPGIRLKKAAKTDSSGEYALSDRVAVFAVRFYRAESVGHILTAACFLLLINTVPQVTLLLFPDMLVFIIFGIIFSNLLEKRALSDYEKRIVTMWTAINWGAAVFAILTLVVLLMLHGGELTL